MININNTINPINHINPNKKLKINNKGNGTIIKMENIFKSENKLNKIKEFIKRLKIKEILENFKFDSSKILNLEWTNTNGNKYYRIISTNEIIFDILYIDRTPQYISKGGFSYVYKTIKNKDGNYINIVLKILQDNVNEDGLKDELMSSLNGYSLSLDYPDRFPKIYEIGLVYQTNGKIVLYTVLDKYFGDITDLMENSQIISKIQSFPIYKLSLFNILTQQLIIPVYELHKMDFTHLDIKLLNFLYKYEIEKNKPFKFSTIECTLTDLASVKKIGIVLDRIHGTEPFISPLYDFCNISGVKCKNSFLYDYYSLGITLLHIFLWIFDEFISPEYKYKYNFPFLNIDISKIKYKNIKDLNEIISKIIFYEKIKFITDRAYFETQKIILETIIENILKNFLEKIKGTSLPDQFMKSIELMKSLLLSNTPCFDEEGVYSLEITETTNLRKIQEIINEYL
jgi:serine/threonine protein kinase